MTQSAASINNGALDGVTAAVVVGLTALVLDGDTADVLEGDTADVLEGDTAAALALRNAVDDAELDLSVELAQLSGPFATALQQVFAFIESRTGVSLTRPEEVTVW